MVATMGIRAPVTLNMTVTGTRIEWHEVRDRVDLATIATNLLGPHHQRKGKRLLWPCPFHDDHHPSFQVDLNRKTWRCWTCGIGGDAAELVKRFNKVDFPAAVKFLADLVGVIPSSREGPSRPAPPIKTPTRPPGGPSGLPLVKATSLVADAAERLWGPGRGNALAYVHGRGLSDDTVRAAGLGYTPGVMIPTRDGDRAFRFSGIVIPWRNGQRLTRVKIRRLDDRLPRIRRSVLEPAADLS